MAGCDLVRRRCRRTLLPRYESLPRGRDLTRAVFEAAQKVGVMCCDVQTS